MNLFRLGHRFEPQPGHNLVINLTVDNASPLTWFCFNLIKLNPKLLVIGLNNGFCNWSQST